MKKDARQLLSLTRSIPPKNPNRLSSFPSLPLGFHHPYVAVGGEGHLVTISNLKVSLCYPLFSFLFAFPFVIEVPIQILTVVVVMDL